MNTPICDFVREYACRNTIRLHMPGHKGICVSGAEKFDITEIDGADELFAPEGIIAQSEKNAGELFCAHTFYSTGGSTLCIQTMLHLTALYARIKGQKLRILAGRNAHRAFINTAALLNIEVEWLWGEESYHCCKVTTEKLSERLNDSDFTALYITSPDYLGNMVDLKDISRACKAAGVLLIVDNAHGAYLKFLPESRHPMDMGADMCCDSAHKTLPVLTGGAYLHISRDAPAMLHERCKSSMSVFGSSSPSYLILESLDAFNGAAEEFKSALAEYVPFVKNARDRISHHGFDLVGDEWLKITIAPRKYGYTGEEIARYLEKNEIFPEFYDRDFVVLMLTPYNGRQDLKKLCDVLCALERRQEIIEAPPAPPRPVAVMPLHEAMFAASEVLPVEHTEGRVLSAAAVSCPPAIPIVIYGEKIDLSAIKAMKYYGMTECSVIRE